MCIGYTFRDYLKRKESGMLQRLRIPVCTAETGSTARKEL